MCGDESLRMTVPNRSSMPMQVRFTGTISHLHVSDQRLGRHIALYHGISACSVMSMRTPSLQDDHLPGPDEEAESGRAGGYASTAASSWLCNLRR